MIEDETALDRIVKSLNEIKTSKQALIRTADTLEGIATGIEIANADKRDRSNDNRASK